MEASQMLDALHFYMEEDYLVSDAAQAQQKTHVRTVIYREFYGIDYKYGQQQKQSQGRQYLDPNQDYDDDLSDVTAFSPTAKPYTPATDFDPSSPEPFGGLLDAPIG